MYNIIIRIPNIFNDRWTVIFIASNRYIIKNSKSIKHQLFLLHYNSFLNFLFIPLFSHALILPLSNLLQLRLFIQYRIISPFPNFPTPITIYPSYLFILFSFSSFSFPSSPLSTSLLAPAFLSASTIFAPFPSFSASVTSNICAFLIFSWISLFFDLFFLGNFLRSHLFPHLAHFDFLQLFLLPLLLPDFGSGESGRLLVLLQQGPPLILLEDPPLLPAVGVLLELLSDGLGDLQVFGADLGLLLLPLQVPGFELREDRPTQLGVGVCTVGEKTYLLWTGLAKENGLILAIYLEICWLWGINYFN